MGVNLYLQSSSGQVAPAMIPVCTVLRLGFVFRVTSKRSMNIVGVPYTEVHFSASIVETLAKGSKLGAGRIIVAPWIRALRLPMTQPKVW